MGPSRDDLAGMIARSIDTRMGVLDVETIEPTTQDFELADYLLARFDIADKR